MIDKGILEKANPRLRNMFRKQVGRELAKDLGQEGKAVSPAVKKRLASSKATDKLQFLTEAVAREQDRQQGLVDPLTGLKERDSFETDLEKHVGDVLRNKEVQSDETLHVVRIDLGMLNAVNAEGGRPKGDAYKKFIAQHLINPLSRENYSSEDFLTRFIYEKFDFFQAYILGGDEFALLIKGKHQDVVDYMSGIKERLEKVPSEELDLLPKRFFVQRTDLMDWGISELDSRMLSDFSAINDSIPRPEKAEGSVKRCAKFLNEIADTISDMTKMHKRISMLIGLLKTEGKTQKYIHLSMFSKKAVGGISDTELQSLGDSKEMKKDIREYIEGFFFRRATKNEVDFQDPFLSKVQKYIREHVHLYAGQL